MVKKHSHWFIPLILLTGLILIIYFPAFDFDFIQWDDDYNIYDNPYFKAGMLWPFWEAPYMGLYIPVVYSVWSLLYHVTGTPDPSVFHAFNILLHFFNSIFVYLLAKNIVSRFFSDQSRPNWPALLGAILFAIHPLQIGAVAWASGGRDLMCVFLTLISMLLYFERKNWLYYFFSLFCFVMALLCKPGIVSLPIVLFLYDWLTNRRLYSAVPFFIAAISVIPLTRYSQSIYMVGMTHQEWYYRPIIALDAVGFYISKLIAPLNLMVDYGRLPSRVIQENLFWPYLGIALIGVFFSFLFARKGRAAWLGLLIVLVGLLPVLGIIPFNFQRISTVTDHYMYFPMVGVSILLAVFLVKKISVKSIAPLSVFFVFLVTMSALRVPVWKDFFVFFEDMKEKNPRSHSAHVMLGDKYYKLGNLQKSEELFQGALRADPKSGVAAGNVSFSLSALGKYDQLLQQMRPYIDNPEFDAINAVHPHTVAMVYLTYGQALESKGQLEEAFKRYCQVFQYKPRDRDGNEAVQAIENISKKIKLKNPAANLNCVLPKTN